jgi:hypothetical protein
MFSIIELLQKLNADSPFVWEVRTDGHDFMILCEETEVHDPKTGAYLTDLSREVCAEWLQKIVDMEVM